jgi:TfoX/Sxy family transcriptional regulator of competence genes
MTADERFEAVRLALDGAPGVTSGKMFAAPGLRVGGKFFACLVKGELVIKLPQERVQALIGGSEGRPFDSGLGRTMKEWLAVPADSPADWQILAEEARDFVAGQRR